jgi:FkbM family methyltransferase
MIWSYAECERTADELLRKTKNYEWAFRILRQAQIYGERFFHRREKLIKRFVSRRKPYFYFQTSDGLKLLGDYRDRYSRHAALYPDEETELGGWIVEAMNDRPGCLIDVGANMGIVSAYVARALPDRKVVALEPTPTTAKRCAAVFAMNGLRNATLIQAAVSDSEGSIAFYSPKGKSESASVVPLKERRVQKITVDKLSVDSLSIEGPVSCIKFDVEGHEPAAIRGALETIRKHRPTVIFEYHWDIAPRLGWTAEEIVELIRSCGEYEFEVRHGGDPPRALPPTREMGTVLNIVARPR